MPNIIKVSNGSSSGTKTIQSAADIPESAWEEMRVTWPYLRRGEIPDKRGNVFANRSPLRVEDWHASIIPLAERHLRAGVVAAGAV